MGFVFLIFTRRTRYLAIAAGIAFHTMTNLVLGISFWFLLGLYVAFIPWDRLFNLPARSEVDSRLPASLPRQLVLMGTVLLALNIALGITRREHGWPFACYPTFAYSLSDVQRGIELCRVESGGQEQPVPMKLIQQGIPKQAVNSLLYMTFTDGLPQQKKIEAWQAYLTKCPR